MAPAGHWQVLGTKLQTSFSNNIRNNFGFLNRAEPASRDDPDKLFVQEGRKVFKEVVPMVASLITAEAQRLNIDPSTLRRLWLHQANAGMNRLIAQRVLGHEASEDESPTVLDTYGNTSSAGSIIAFHLHSHDLGRRRYGADLLLVARAIRPEPFLSARVSDMSNEILDNRGRGQVGWAWPSVHPKDANLRSLPGRPVRPWRSWRGKRWPGRWGAGIGDSGVFP